mmetsp:Transcript_4268/g.7036  ORF Transcript_4268/g.7036 Transcript_4268/m.7036 type:complete len:295 (+) Transcript_4268:377-1261(+)
MGGASAVTTPPRTTPSTTGQRQVTVLLPGQTAPRTVQETPQQQQAAAGMVTNLNKPSRQRIRRRWPRPVEIDQEDDNATATTEDLTTLAGKNSDRDMDLEDDADFAAENAPRPPPEEILYGRQGKLRRSILGGQQPHPGGSLTATWREWSHIAGTQPQHSKVEPTVDGRRHGIGKAKGASITPQTVLRTTQGSSGNAGPHPGGIGNAMDRIQPCGGNTVGVSTNPQRVVTTSQGDSGNAGPHLGGIGSRANNTDELSSARRRMAEEIYPTNHGSTGQYSSCPSLSPSTATTSHP